MKFKKFWSLVNSNAQCRVFSLAKCTTVMQDVNNGETQWRGTQEHSVLFLQLFHKSKIIPNLRVYFKK